MDAIVPVIVLGICLVKVSADASDDFRVKEIARITDKAEASGAVMTFPTIFATVGVSVMPAVNPRAYSPRRPRVAVDASPATMDRAAVVTRTKVKTTVEAAAMMRWNPRCIEKAVAMPSAMVLTRAKRLVSVNAEVMVKGITINRRIVWDRVKPTVRFQVRFKFTRLIRDVADVNDAIKIGVMDLMTEKAITMTEASGLLSVLVRVVVEVRTVVAIVRGRALRIESAEARNAVIRTGMPPLNRVKAVEALKALVQAIARVMLRAETTVAVMTFRRATRIVKAEFMDTVIARENVAMREMVMLVAVLITRIGFMDRIEVRAVVIPATICIPRTLIGDNTSVAVRLN